MACVGYASIECIECIELAQQPTNDLCRIEVLNG